MNVGYITRLWLAVTTAVEDGDMQAFQLAFWRMEVGFLRVSQALWDIRPQDRQVFKGRLAVSRADDQESGPLAGAPEPNGEVDGCRLDIAPKAGITIVVLPNGRRAIVIVEITGAKAAAKIAAQLRTDGKLTLAEPGPRLPGHFPSSTSRIV